LERCRATFALERALDTTVVRALLSTGERLDLVRARGTISFRYFDPTPQGGWVTAWGNSGTLPAAMAIITPRDTSVTRAGGRG
jgi:hypothetical protein